MKRQNQESLFDEILKLNRGRFAGIAHAYASGSEADDLLQEILLQIWHGLAGFRQESSVHTWCYRVALNTAMSWRRKAGRKRKNLPSEARDFDAVAGTADGHDSTRLLEKFLQSLSSGDRALVLMYLDDLSGKEIAEVAGIKEGAVRTRIHRIKKRLEDWSVTDE